jgi:hypothetical protein
VGLRVVSFKKDSSFVFFGIVRERHHQERASHLEDKHRVEFDVDKGSHIML